MTHCIAALLQTAVGQLAPRSDSPRLDAELLLCHVLGLPRSALIVRAAESIGAARRQEFHALLQRRARGEPVAYLTGMREFWSLPLAVSPDVLVPRPETELLVELGLGLVPQNRASSVLDLGTGSGAIALAIASERPVARITAVDISRAALAVAMANAHELDLPQVTWRCGSWFDAVPQQCFDLILSNPPYVAGGDPALELLAAEPMLALSPGPSGLEALHTIIDGAPRHLNRGGWLLLEHGSTQAPLVTELLERCGFDAIRSHADHAGAIRVTIANFHPLPKGFS